MSGLDYLVTPSILTGLGVLVVTGVTIVLLVHVVPWLIDSLNLRSYPGPWLAKFSDVWLGWVALNGHRSDVIHEMHQKYGMSCSCTRHISC